MEAKFRKIFASFFGGRHVTSAAFSDSQRAFAELRNVRTRKTPGIFRRSSLPDHLEIDVQICEEEIELIRWIDCDGQTTYISARAQIVVIPPPVAVSQFEVHSASQVICRLNGNPVHILLGIEKIVIDQVRIERELLDLLIPKVDPPIVLLL
jgi:hypothetical protein